MKMDNKAYKYIFFCTLCWHVKTIQKTSELPDRWIQNWFYLHLLSSWLDLANGGCMRWISNWSLYSQVHFGWEWWAEPRHTSPVHVDVTLHSTLLIQTNSSLCKATESWVWGRKKGSEIYFRLSSSGVVLKTIEWNWVIKPFISRYLGTVSTDYFLFLALFP